MASFSMANEGQYQKDENNLGYKLRSDIIDKVNEETAKERRDVLPLKCTLPPNSFVNLKCLKELKLPRSLEILESMKLTDSKPDLLIYISSFSSGIISTKRLAEEDKAVINYYDSNN